MVRENLSIENVDVPDFHGEDIIEHHQRQLELPLDAYADDQSADRPEQDEFDDIIPF